jgi:hypothetical protein
MIVALTHEVDMSTVYVQLKGLDHAIPVKGDKIDRDLTKQKLVVTDSQGRVIGEFSLDSVMGWWIGS